MTPNTKTKNLLIWGAALLLALFLAFVGSWVEQASTIPEDQAINWRRVWIDVAKSLLTLAPVVAAGLNLPRLGKEQVATMVNELGKDEALHRLETPVTDEKIAKILLPHIDITLLARRILDENRSRQLAERFPNGPISEKISQPIP